MAYISFQPSDFFNNVLYTGDGTSDQDVTGVGFQPDWVWLKARSQGYNHRLYDSTRGVLKNLQSNSTAAEATATNGLISFDTDGFSVSQGGDEYNRNGETYVGWNWKANGGTTSSNTDGDITSTVQVNSTAGFSIVQFTKTGDDQAVGHGLGKKPKLIIIKPTNTTGNWIVTPEIDGVMSNKYLLLNATDALGTDGSYAEPTSSVFYVSNQIAGNNTHIGYVFTDIEGYSKFGSGTGTGTSSTNFIYTGFKPSWVMIKRTDSSDSWAIFDNKRPSYNVTPNRLFADLNNAESTSSSNQIDMVSNGFVARGTSATWNASGSSFIYMAFAENPFVTSGAVPVTAR